MFGLICKGGFFPKLERTSNLVQREYLIDHKGVVYLVIKYLNAAFSTKKNDPTEWSTI